jgi:transcriptional regulator with XRE-family HTH domain
VSRNIKHAILVSSVSVLTLTGTIRIVRSRLAGFHQADVANTLGVSRPLVSRWEADTSTPNVHQFAGLVDLYAAPWLYEILDGHPHAA